MNSASTFTPHIAKAIFMLDENRVGVRGLDHEQFICGTWTRRLQVEKVNCWYVFEASADPIYKSKYSGWHSVDFRKSWKRIEMRDRGDLAYRSIFPKLNEWLLENFPDWPEGMERILMVRAYPLNGELR